MIINRILIYTILSMLWIFINFSNISASNYLPDMGGIPSRLKDQIIDFYTDIFESMDEPSIWNQPQNHNLSSFRLVYLPGKRHYILVLRLSQINTHEYVLIIKQQCLSSKGQYYFIHNDRINISQNKFDSLLNLFESLDFNKVSTIGPLEAEFDWLDLSTCTLEYFYKGKYNFITRAGPKNSDSRWDSDPQSARKFQEMREKIGYPYIDRQQNAITNDWLVGIAEYLIKLSGLKIEIR